jgi:hypothetical protein
MPSVDTPRGLRTPLHKERAFAPAPSEESPEAQEAAVSAWSKRLLGNDDVERVGSSSQPSVEPLPHEPAEVEQVTLQEPAAATVEIAMAERRSTDDPVDPVELGREFAGILAEHEEEEA